MNEDDAESLVEGLRHNRRLQTIHFGYRTRILTLNEYISEKLVSILQEHNTSLQHILGVRYASPEHEERITELLEWNRHAMEFSAAFRELDRPAMDFSSIARRVPMPLWSAVLNRIDKRECNDFVRMLAKHTLSGGQAGAASITSIRDECQGREIHPSEQNCSRPKGSSWLRASERIGSEKTAPDFEL
jgi:hypothetical protein